MNDNITQTQHLASSGASYNPYNGHEALKIIMSRIYAQLEQHQDFGQHLAYTHFNYKFRLEFTADKEGVTVAEGGSRHLERAHTVVGNSLAAPDDGRREAGLVVPQPTLTAGGMVDVPLQKQ